MGARQISDRRRRVFRVLAVVLCLGLVEGAAAVGLWVMERAWVTRRGFVERLAGEPESPPAVEPGAAEDPEHQPSYHLHPFLGFVRNVEAVTHSLNGRLVEVPVNEHGFFGPDPLTEPDERAFQVALTGGSVALELFLQAEATLRAELEALPVVAGRRVEIVSLALGGMKQPQQLVALSYFLALGAHYDMVINLDGFNELVLTVRENLPQGVFPFFPRNWALHGARAVDLQSTAAIGRLAETRSQLRRHAGRLRESPLRHSYLGLLAWNARRRGLERHLAELEIEVREVLEERDLGPQQRGPAYERQHEFHADSWEGITEDVLGVWATSSELMWRLCEASGIAYHHFLQPNQWVAGSKVPSRYERRRAFNAVSEYANTATAGYPALIEAGRGLAEQGLPYADLTGIYRDVERTVYVDNCCHVNELGNRIMARAIAEAIGAGG